MYNRFFNLSVYMEVFFEWVTHPSTAKMVYRYMVCLILTFYLSIKEGVFTRPKIKIQSGYSQFGFYNNNTIFIPNRECWLDVFFHEWRHHYQKYKMNWLAAYDKLKYERYVKLFVKCGSKNIHLHHYGMLLRSFANEFEFEKDAFFYQIKKCHKRPTTQYMMVLLRYEYPTNKP